MASFSRSCVLSNRSLIRANSKRYLNVGREIFLSGVFVTCDTRIYIMCDDNDFQNIKSYAKNRRLEYFFDSSAIKRADGRYVAWVDLLGAGHLMTVSIEKTANAIIRLHMAVYNACCGGEGVISVPINDGVFIIARSKKDIIFILKKIIVDLSCVFMSTDNPEDRTMLSCGLAYGPVYIGDDLRDGVGGNGRKEKYDAIFRQIAFGSAVIQAYKEERNAAPFGVAIHESARSFSSNEDKPFQDAHLRWWSSDADINGSYSFPPLKTLRDYLKIKLYEQLNYIENHLIYSEISIEKINIIRNKIKWYY